MSAIEYVRQSSTKGCVQRQREAITSWATSQKVEVIESVEETGSAVGTDDENDPNEDR